MKDYEKDIVLFVYRFKILLSTNIKYLLGNKKYYQVVVKRLVDKYYLRRYKTKYLMLGQVGKKYIKELGYSYSKPSYKKEYVERMTTISLLVCSKNVANILNKYFPVLKISIVDFEKYIREFKIYYRQEIEILF